MKTRMVESSLESYAGLQKEKQSDEIFRCIKRVGEITAKGISFDTGIPINAVTGRVNDLQHAQRIKVVKSGKDVRGGKNVSFYAVRHESDPLNIFEKSWEQRYKEAYKFLELKGLDFEFDAIYNHEL